MLPIHRAQAVCLLLLLALLPLVGGCAAAKPGGHISLYSEQAHRFFSEDFKEAWYASSHEGEWDIVLVNDPTYQDVLAHQHGPLSPLSGQPVQQVVHIQVLWKPLKGTEGHTPAVINSSVEWHVFGSKDQRLDMLRYGGAALTSLSFNMGRANVHIREGSLDAPRRVGDISDPIGPATFDGDAIALRNDRRVNEVLQAVHDQAARAGAPTPASSSP